MRIKLKNIAHIFWQILFLILLIVSTHLSFALSPQNEISSVVENHQCPTELVDEISTQVDECNLSHLHSLFRGVSVSGNIQFTLDKVNVAKGGAKLWPAASNGRTVVNGIEYTTHALERMQPVGTIMKGTKVFSRGVPPSAVENAIKFGKVTPGNTAAEVVRTFENVRVITNPQGTRVISVIKMGH